jgi:hypothetical protein
LSSGLDHILWIGGAQGAGKSTAARIFAHHAGLRLYLVDAFTYSHAERAETGPFPTMRAFGQKTMDERWLHPEPEEMAEEFLAYARERFQMIVDDLRALPREPAIVAEGPHLLPELVAPLVASPQAAVWLVPTPHLQRGLHGARPSAVPGHTSDADLVQEKVARRNELLAEAIRRSALETGLAVTEIQSYVDATLALEKRLGPLVPEASTIAPETVRRLRRDENLMVLDQVLRYLASAEAPPDHDGRIAFSCECTRLGCVDRVEIDLSDYERLVRDWGFLSAH